MTRSIHDVRQDDRVRAASSRGMTDDHPKTRAVRARILAGQADDHPAVQAAVFYGS